MKVAIIGAGKIGNIRAKALDKDDELIFCVDTNMKSARNLADQYGAVSLSDYHVVCKNNNIDTVIVSTSNDMLFPVAMDAIINGKNVIVEKPVGKNSYEISQLIMMAEKHGSTVLCGYNHRKHFSILNAKNMLHEIGEVFYINGVYAHGGAHEEKPSWRTDINKSGFGELGEKGCHLIDLSRWFFNMQDDELFDTVVGKTAKYYRTELDDNAFCTLQTAKGQIAHLYSSSTGWRNTFQFSITGQYGNIILDGLGGSYGTESMTLNLLRRNKTKPAVYKYEFLDDDDSWSREWFDFKECVRKHLRPSSNLWSSLSVMDTVEAIYDTCS